MTELRFLLSVARRLSVTDWAHGVLGCVVLVAWAILLIGGPV